jgi:Ulp1 family protease
MDGGATRRAIPPATSFFSRVEHWSAVCIDKGTKTIHFFDPSGLKQQELDTIIKQDIAEIVGSTYRLRYEQPFTQRDGHSCGIFVLMFAEWLVFKRIFPDVDRNLLQYLRYRYMCLAL